MSVSQEPSHHVLSIDRSSRIPPSTRLRRAIYLRSLSLVKRIISSNASLPNLVRNVDFDDKCNTSLHLAALLGLPEIALYLVEQGHEDQGISRNVNGITPLMFAAQAGGDEGDRTTAGRIAVAKMLAQRFPDLTAIQDKTGMTAFSHAARQGTNQLITMLLGMAPPKDLLPYVDDEEHAPLPSADHPFLSTRDLEGNTPLHHASAAGQLKTLRMLILTGADAGARNLAMWSPIDYSASVSAEVYLRNLLREREQTKEFERGIATGAVNITRIRGPSDVTRQGGVRLVRSEGSITSDDTTDDDDDDVVGKARTRAGT